MRYRLMASYEGSPFEAGLGPGQGDIVLFAACPPPEDLGFEPATGHWRKQLRLADVQAVWESRPVGMFRGERCMVLDDLGDRLHIGYLGHDGFKAEQLGYWQVDRGVFELVAPRSEVSHILEERTEYPRQPAPSRPVTAPMPGSTPLPSSYRPASTPVPGSYSPGSTGQHTIPAAYMPATDSRTGVALPVARPAPLPLEAEALRAATAARRSRLAASGRALAHRAAPLPAAPAAAPPAAAPPAPAPPAAASPAAAPPAAASPAAAPQAGSPGSLMEAKQRRSGRARLATELVFADLAALAGIPAESYAIGAEVDGAICLVQTDKGFEVFNSVQGGRQGLQSFENEEAACFYLFGVLAAEAARNGSLSRTPAGLVVG